MRHQKEEDYLSGNLTAMIDVVFQLIIFFVCTVTMQDSNMSPEIELALAPHGAPAVDKAVGEITINVNKKGVVSIMNMPFSYNELVGILKSAMAESHGNQLPVLIRGDGAATHEAIKAVMDACATAGIYKIKFAAIQTHAG